jgi:hypothetical protein
MNIRCDWGRHEKPCGKLAKIRITYKGFDFWYCAEHGKDVKSKCNERGEQYREEEVET